MKFRVVIRFGRDHDPDCMRQDEVLYKIADRVKSKSRPFTAESTFLKVESQPFEVKSRLSDISDENPCRRLRRDLPLRYRPRS